MARDERPSPSSWLHRVRRGILILALLLFAAVLLAVLAAYHPRTEPWLLDQVTARLAAATGIELSAARLEVDLLARRLALRNAALAVEESSRPFLAAEEIRLTLGWTSWLGRLHLRNLRIVAPALDLEAPWPVLGSRAPLDPSLWPSKPLLLRLDELSIDSGRIDGAVWIEGLDVSVTASGGEIDLELGAARLGFEPSDFGVEMGGSRIEAEALSGRAQGRVGAAVELDSLTLIGDGLELAARGRLGNGASPALSYVIQVSPGRLLGRRQDGGRIVAGGELGTSAAGLKIEAYDLPLDWIADAARIEPPVGLADTTITADAELSFGRGPVTGEGRFTLRRPGAESPVLAADVAARRDDGEGSLSLVIDADLLPALAGRRHLSGTLRAADWRALGSGEVRQARLEIEEMTLEAVDREIGRLGVGFPGALVEAIGITERLFPRTVWALDLQADGPLVAPRWRAVSRLAADGEPLIEARLASGREGPWHCVIEAEVLPAWPGRRHLAGGLAFAPRGVGALELEAVSLEAQMPLTEWDAWMRERPDLANRLKGLVPDSGSLAMALQSGVLEAIVQANGPVGRPAFDLEASWRPAVREPPRVIVRSSTSVGIAPVQVSVEAIDLALGELGLELAGESLAGRLGGSFEWRRATSGAQFSIDLEAPDLTLGDFALEELVLRGVGDARRFDVESLRLRWAGGPLVGTLVDARGRIQPHRRATARVELRDLPSGLPAADLDLRLSGGTLHAAAAVGLADGPRTSNGPILNAALPLASLAKVLEAMGARLEKDADFLAGPREALLRIGDEGPIQIEFEELDLETLAVRWGAGIPLTPRGTASGRFQLEPQQEMASSISGRLVLENLRFAAPRGEIVAEGPLIVELDDHDLILQPVILHRQGRLSLAGKARLDACKAFDGTPCKWPPAAVDRLGALIESFLLEVRGSLPADALAPLLGDAVGSGEFAVEVRLGGDPAAPDLSARLSGPDAELFFATPYATRISAPEILLSADRGRLVVESARGRINDGTFELGGDWRRGRDWDLWTRLRGVRYRVDYGLSLLVDGDLAIAGELLSGESDAERRLSGEFVVERGLLRRDIPLTQELLNQVLAPRLEGTAGAFAESLALDLQLATRDGVRIKNNLADLRVAWTPLAVRGTLARPVIEGRLEVDPGGKVYGLSQTLRLDKAAIVFPGTDGQEPQLDLETTSSLDDPTLDDSSGLWSSRLWTVQQGAGRDGEIDVSQALREGLIEQSGDFLAGFLGDAIGTELGYRPLSIFGETNPEARLTLTQRLSRQVDFSTAVDLREVEGQVFLLEVHELPALPHFAFQAFSNDEGNEGLIVQQTVELGRVDRTTDGRRLRKIVFEVPAGVRKRAFERAVDLGKGDALPAGSRFEIEVDVLEHLRSVGFPDAAVTVEELPVGERRADLVVRTRPGERVRARFTGERPPRVMRPSLAGLYRPGAATDEAGEVLRRATVRALRAEGFLDPRVVVTEARSEATQEVVVEVAATAGRRILPGPPRFPDLEPEDANYLAARFQSRLSRVELAAAGIGGGMPLEGDREASEALKRLRDGLAELGLEAARITGLTLDEPGRELVVHLDPGPRQRLASVAIRGLDEGETARWLESIALHPGDPVRRPGLARVASRIDQELRRRGHADSRTRIVLTPTGRPDELNLVFEADPGPVYRVEEVRFEGLGATRAGWARRVARFDVGGHLDSEALGEARRRLYDAGIFERVATNTERRADGGSTVVFDVAEQPRFTLAYGLRWENGEGMGAVVDVLDRNLFGRGVTVGGRALLSRDEQRLRFYSLIPRFRGTASSLELFVEGGDGRFEDGTEERGLTASAQLTVPLSRAMKGRFYGILLDRQFDRDGDGVEAEFDERVFSPIFGWQLLRDRRTDPLGMSQDPRGSFLSLDLVGTSTSLGSDFSAARLFTQWKSFQPAGRRSGLTWAHAYRIGLLETFDNALPRVDRFLTGGEFSVRGYPTDSLGPRSPDGTLLGGEFLLVINQELRFPLRDRLSGLVFFDAGNVWRSLDEVDGEIFTAAGLGLRAATPIGPLRLDFAFPVDRREGDPAVKVYFGFGNAF